MTPLFHENGLLMNQEFCCANTFSECLNGWWGSFLQRIPGTEDGKDINSPSPTDM